MNREQQNLPFLEILIILVYCSTAANTLNLSAFRALPTIVIMMNLRHLVFFFHRVHLIQAETFLLLSKRFTSEGFKKFRTLKPNIAHSQVLYAFITTVLIC